MAFSYNTLFTPLDNNSPFYSYRRKLNEVEIDLVLIQTLMIYYVNHVLLMLTSIFKHNFHKKRNHVLHKNKVNLSLAFTQKLGY